MRASVRFASCALLLTTLSSSASAQLLLASPPASSDSIEHAELAYAIGDGPPVTWLSLRVRRGPIAVVAALSDGARVDGGALDAWLESLETTASPRVLLPRDVTDCGESSSFIEVAWPRGGGAAAEELLLDAPEDVVLTLATQGLQLSSELPQASSYALWIWPASDSAQTTRTMRVQGGATPLTFSPGLAFPILLSAITRGALTYQGELDTSALEITFVAGSHKQTDYRSRVVSWVDEHTEPLLEARSRGLVFDWSIHGDLVSVAPLLRNYALRAAAEVPELNADACSAALGRLRSDASGAGEACPGASDAELALRAADPELATLQRFVVSGQTGVSPESLSGGGQPRAPVVRASSLDDSACTTTELPPIVIDPVPRGGSDEPRAGSEVVVDDTVVIDERQPVEVDCSGAPGPEPTDDDYNASDDGDCSSDSSSSSDSDSSEVDCSGDTSSTNESASDDGDCSSDSSGTSSADDSGCDGGPGDGESEEDTGYDGDTCTGSAAPPRTTQKSQAAVTRGKRRGGPQRLKTSLWSVAFAALVLPIRRRKRGARAHG